MPAPKTPAERRAKSDSKKKAKGMSKIYVWAYPESTPVIRRHAKLCAMEVEEKRANVE